MKTKRLTTHMKAAGLITVLTILATTKIHAINIDSLEHVEAKELRQLPRQAVTLQAGFNVSEETSLSLELDYQWYPLHYAGVGFGVEIDDDYGERPLLEAHDDDDYDPDRIIKLNLHPMLCFRTPTLWMNRRRSWGLLLRCDPGFVLSFPRNDEVYVTRFKPTVGNQVVLEDITLKNHDGRWTFWRVRTAITIRADNSLISLGWGVTNYNIAYCRNNMYYNGERYYGYDNYDMTHSLFVSFSYCF